MDKAWGQSYMDRMQNDRDYANFIAGTAHAIDKAIEDGKPSLSMGSPMTDRVSVMVFTDPSFQHCANLLMLACTAGKADECEKYARGLLHELLQRSESLKLTQ